MPARRKKRKRITAGDKRAMSEGVYLGDGVYLYGAAALSFLRAERRPWWEKEVRGRGRRIR